MDITNLTGEDLFAALTSGEKVTVKTNKPTKQDSSTGEIIPTNFTSPWTKKALILIMHEVECRCGETYEHPNDRVLLKEEAFIGKAIHPSVHYRELTIGEVKLARELPFQLHTHKRNVDVCGFCAHRFGEDVLEADIGATVHAFPTV